MILENFIVFEGIDGAGTSTQIEILSKRPESARFFLTAEPTKDPIGLFIRQMLSGKLPLDPRTAAYLFSADRNEHLYGKKGILEHLKENKIVISDRYIFSSLAYQSIDCGMEIPEMLNKAFPLPQMLFFFDVDPEITLKRIKSREITEIYEKLDFLKKTVKTYRAIIQRYEKEHPEIEIIRIDATLPIEKTSEIIWSYMKKLPILKA